MTDTTEGRMVALYTEKGGAGVTTLACALAALDPWRPALVVDLAAGGDVAATCGRAGDTGHTAAVDVRPGLTIWRPANGYDPDDVLRTVGLLAASGTLVVVDAGTRPDRAAAYVMARADLVLEVVAASYLALRHATQTTHEAHALVVVEEEGGALRTADAEAVTNLPAVATVTRDPAVARATDAGILVDRVPARLRHALGGVLREAATR